MWNNLKNWQKSIIIIFISLFILCISGKLFVTIGSSGNGKYVYVPLIYSIFLVLPILVIKYSNRKALKIVASIILGIFLLIILVPIIFNWSEFYGNALSSSGNPFAAIFSLLYVMPLMGGLITFMILTGSTM